MHSHPETSLANPEVNEPALVALAEARADYLGVSGSFLCLVHCLAPQVLATMGSVGLSIGTFFESELWILVFWVSCLAAVWSATRKTAFPKVALYLWLAFLLFSLGTGLEFFFHWDHALSYLGSSLLIIGHLYHLYLQQHLVRSRSFQCAP